MANVKNYMEQGGEKLVIGGDIVFEKSPVANQPASTATAIAGLKDDFNALLTKLKAAGIMEADA